MVFLSIRKFCFVQKFAIAPSFMIQSRLSSDDADVLHFRWLLALPSFLCHSYTCALLKALSPNCASSVCKISAAFTPWFTGNLNDSFSSAPLA